jgi:hypothetical protein
MLSTVGIGSPFGNTFPRMIIPFIGKPLGRRIFRE